MNKNCKSCGRESSNIEKWKYTIMTTLLFLVIVNPMTYNFVNRYLGKFVGRISNAGGCPTELGIVVHAIVFTLLLRGLMEVNV